MPARGRRRIYVPGRAVGAAEEAAGVGSGLRADPLGGGDALREDRDRPRVGDGVEGRGAPGESDIVLPSGVDADGHVVAEVREVFGGALDAQPPAARICGGEVGVKDGAEAAGGSELDRACLAGLRIGHLALAPPSLRAEQGFEAVAELVERLAVRDSGVHRGADIAEDVVAHRLRDGEGARVGLGVGVAPVERDVESLVAEEFDGVDGRDVEDLRFRRHRSALVEAGVSGQRGGERSAPQALGDPGVVHRAEEGRVVDAAPEVVVSAGGGRGEDGVEDGVHERPPVCGQAVGGNIDGVIAAGCGAREGDEGAGCCDLGAGAATAASGYFWPATLAEPDGAGPGGTG